MVFILYLRPFCNLNVLGKTGMENRGSAFSLYASLFIIFCSDAISESNPRVIDDTRARKLANDLRRCSYYETCATYGLNVERVFQDGKQY